jgi:hypothetical protein
MVPSICPVKDVQNTPKQLRKVYAAKAARLTECIIMRWGLEAVAAGSQRVCLRPGEIVRRQQRRPPP